MLHYLGLNLADDNYIQTSFTTRTMQQEKPGIKRLSQEPKRLTNFFLGGGGGGLI